jgi:hypothetical protein
LPEGIEENEEKVPSEKPVLWSLLEMKVLKRVHNENDNNYLISVVKPMTLGFDGDYFRLPVSGTGPLWSTPCIAL